MDENECRPYIGRGFGLLCEADIIVQQNHPFRLAGVISLDLGALVDGGGDLRRLSEAVPMGLGMVVSPLPGLANEDIWGWVAI